MYNYIHVLYIYTKQPNVVEDYFDNAKVIDIANQIRQPRWPAWHLSKWRTQKCEHHLFSTLLGMINTCAWRHFRPDSANDEHADFTEELTLQLLTNTFDKAGGN